MKQQLERGYTLSEAVITLGIIGVIAAILLPLISTFRPDTVKIKWIKTYDAIVYVVKNLADNEILFPPTMIHNDIIYDLSATPFINRAETFCTNFIDRVNAPNGSSCSNNENNYIAEFVTQNRTAWKVTSTSGFDYENSEGTFQAIIDIYLNGNTNNASEHFQFEVKPNGSVRILDERGKAYNLTRTIWRKNLFLGLGNTDPENSPITIPTVTPETPNNPENQEPNNSENQEPNNSENQEPNNPENQEPNNSENQEPNNSENQEPNNSENQEPNNSENQEPNNSENQEPNNSENQEPNNSENQEPNNPENQDPNSNSNSDKNATITLPSDSEHIRVSDVTDLISGETYYIDDALDLVALQNYVNGGGKTAGVILEMSQDIDMSGIEFIGIGSKGDNSFNGIFNGNDYSIKNLEINSSEEKAGLFGYILKANINDVNLDNCKIKGRANVGSLAGMSYKSTISGCKSTGEVFSSTYSAEVGGLVGFSMEGTSINKSFFKGNVTSQSGSAGGVAGIAYGTSISNSEANANVTGESYVGGVIGMASKKSNIENCTASGNVVGNRTTGGFVGQADGNSTFSNCYSAANATVETSNVGGFIARANYANLNNCYASGDVSGVLNVGGFLGGSNTASINNCAALGNVTGKTSVGGFIGNLYSDYVYFNCTESYYNKNGCTTGVGTGVVLPDGVDIKGKTVEEINNIIMN